MIRFSAIIPVYNRPDEVEELLQTMVEQTLPIYEVIVVEDGSTVPCKVVVDRFLDKLPVKYYSKENTGQGFSRNFGFERATGDYFLVFDSDCLLPPHYLENVADGLEKYELDAFGGPDRAAKGFTPTQKAISYSMTSIFTTGGIRGAKKHAGTFHPRSFNMGISAEVFAMTGGYKITRMGEDIEFSIRIISEGFKVGLLEEAFVYHKRRTSLIQFFKQLRFFGRARINVSRFFPGEIKVIHWMPAIFLLGELCWLGSWFFNREIFSFGLWGNIAFALLVLIDASREYKSIYIGCLSIAAAYIQLLAYGTGLITEGAKKLVSG
jgi:glycosyltransferase involved in cell wall biosynthesis